MPPKLRSRVMEEWIEDTIHDGRRTDKKHPVESLLRNLTSTENKQRLLALKLTKAEEERVSLLKRLSRLMSKSKQDTSQAKSLRISLEAKITRLKQDVAAVRGDLRKCTNELSMQTEETKILKKSIAVKNADEKRSKNKAEYWRAQYLKAKCEYKHVRATAWLSHQQIAELKWEMNELNNNLDVMTTASSTSIDCTICVDKKHELVSGISALKCGHVYCTPCITKVWKNNGQRRISCPQCRAIHEMPPIKLFMFQQ